jgi:curved DNA-binding protein CbpA
LSDRSDGSDRLDRLDYYTLLGVAADAEPPAIKGAFRRFARKYHPDRFAGAPAEKVERASRIYRRGSEAVQILTDPVARRAYDAALRAGTLRLRTEDRERAEARERAPEEERTQPIRSPQALAFYNRAAEAAREGRWRDAWKAIKTALEHEPENPLMKTRLAQIEIRLRRGG